MSEQQQAEGPILAAHVFGWCRPPESKTDTGPAFQPTPETEAFLRGEDVPADDDE